MAVTSYGEINDGRGHQKSHAAFKKAHEENTNALINLAEGKPGDEARPVYDPQHPDNHWPIMLHHHERGELTIGRTLKGITDPALRREVLEDNHQAKKNAIKVMGYRSEPYVKPQIAVLDPAVEKAALQKQLAEQQGQIVALSDMVSKLLAGQQSAKQAKAAEVSKAEAAQQS